MKISAIACVGKDWSIGIKNSLIWNCSADLRFFKKYTDGKILIVGRNTWDSLPKKPLENRVVIVVSSTLVHDSDAICVDSPNKALHTAKHIAKVTGQDIVVIGGEAIYRALADHYTELMLTVIDDTCPEADSHFPEGSVKGEWALTGVYGHVTTSCGKSGTILRKQKKIE